MSIQVARCCGVLVLGAAVTLAGPALRAEGQARAAAAVDLSGRWRLNKALSDDEQAKERTAIESGAERQPPDPGPTGEPEREGSEGGRAGRGGGQDGRVGRGGSSPNIDENDPRGAKNAAGPPSAMTVTQFESEIVVEERPGQTRNLYPNGKTYNTDEGTAQIRTSWKDGKLVVEKKSVRGWRLVETWELAPDRGRIVIHLLLKGGSRPTLSLTRVYDRDGATTPR
jgi:hypothetical protein